MPSALGLLGFAVAWLVITWPAIVVRGSSLRGQVEIGCTPPGGYQQTMICLHRTKGRQTREEVLWKAERQVAAASVLRGMNGFLVPVLFDLPADARPTERIDGREDILWRLEMTDTEDHFHCSLEMAVQ